MTAHPPQPKGETVGPEGLVEFLMSPPWWLVAILLTLAAVTGGVLVWRAYQFDIDLEDQREMQIVLGTLTGVTIAASLLRAHDPTPWYVDAIGGLAAGYAPVLLAQTKPAMIAASRLIPSSSQRRSAGWGALFTAGYALYFIAEAVARFWTLRVGAVSIVLIATGMFMYNWAMRAQSESGQTSRPAN